MGGAAIMKTKEKKFLDLFNHLGRIGLKRIRYINKLVISVK